MRPPRSSSRSGVPVAVRVIPLLCVVACAYETRGVIEGDLTHTMPPAAPTQPGAPPPADGAPAPAHERVRFTWQSSDGGISGQIQTALPGGEVFMGDFHEITRTMVGRTSRFCGSWYGGWYGGPWMGPGWYWGGAWPYYGSCDGFVTFYSGQTIAMLDGDRSTKMRCHFLLDEPGMGMRGGGWGECQVSNGDRITAVFDASDAQTLAPGA